MHHRTLSDNGAIENIISFNDDGELIARDVMSADRVQKVLDANSYDRNHCAPNKDSYGRIVARIPTPVWANWRKDWAANHADKWTWQTYMAQKLNDPDYALLRTGGHIGLSERNKTGATAPKTRSYIQQPKTMILAP